ncbi:MAG TPA: TRAP transporter small permease [Candidatus Acidoferrum sp.]|nr:TRAP transporter small permease [Candidatus Acidoferrum sp.]
MGQPQKTDHTIDVVSRQMNRLAERAMAVCLAAMTLVVGVQIAGRFLFSYSIFWSDELTRFLLIWVAFLGMSAGVRRGAHPGIDSLVRALPPPAGRLIVSLAVCCSLIFFAVMTGYGSLLAFRTWAQRSPSLGLRMGIPYLAVPTAGALMLLHSIAAWLRTPAAGTEGVRNGSSQ